MLFHDANESWMFCGGKEKKLLEWPRREDRACQSPSAEQRRSAEETEPRYKLMREAEEEALNRRFTLESTAYRAEPGGLGSLSRSEWNEKDYTHDNGE